MCLSYLALWFVVALGEELWAAGDYVAIPFLPAFVRVIGFILIGLWIVPFLFLAFGVLIFTGALAYPELAVGDQLFLGLLIASGGPFALALATATAKMPRDLLDLSAPDLFMLCLVCASGSAVSYGAGLALVDLRAPDLSLTTSIFVGDMIGQLVVLGLVASLLRALPLKPRS